MRVALKSQLTWLWTLFGLYNFNFSHLISKSISVLFGSDLLGFYLYKKIGKHKRSINTIEDYRTNILNKQFNQIAHVDSSRVMSYFSFLIVGLVGFALALLIHFSFILMEMDFLEAELNITVSVAIFFPLFLALSWFLNLYIGEKIDKSLSVQYVESFNSSSRLMKLMLAFFIPLISFFLVVFSACLCMVDYFLFLSLFDETVLSEVRSYFFNYFSKG